MLRRMAHPYDELSVEALRARPLLKWRHYDEDVLPLWVADMDFPVAPPIRRALHEYADGDLFGYPEWSGLPGVREAVCEHLERTTGWRVDPEAVWILPGTVPGLFGAVKAFASHGDGVLAPSPVYFPFRMATERQGRVYQEADLAETDAGWRLDPEALDAAIDPSTRLLMLCHPHNPTGRSFDAGELDALAERVREHRLFVVSDELHADLTYDGGHVPFASLSPEMARRTVTLLGPTKAFNLAGLRASFAIAEDEGVRARFQQATFGFLMAAPSASQVAARAAYREGGPWLRDTLAYLRANRDHVAEAVATRLPGVRMHSPEATYLAWLDFRATAIAEDPAAALLERGRLGLNDGARFGAAGRGFARLNFATSRAVVDEALGRIERVLAEA
jgi:cystathionine beta-lyase